MLGEEKIISGELHDVAETIRNRGLVESAGSLLSQLRGHRSHLLDLLIESHPEKDDGGSVPGMLPKGYSRRKLETRLAVSVRPGSKPSVDSMARLTLYGAAGAAGAGEKRVAVLSAVVTRASRRRKGLARKTVIALLEKQLPAGVPVRLVCESRAAANLYSGLGFEVKGKFMEK
jgi:hypothetical protein